MYPTQLHNLLWVEETPSLARGTHAAFKQGIISVHLDQDDLLVLTGLNTNPMVTHTVGPESCAEAVTLPDGSVQFSWEPPGLVVSPRLVVLAVAFSSRASANSEDTLRLLGRFAASGSTGAAPAAPAVTPAFATTPLLSAMPGASHIVAQRVGVTPQTERPIVHSTPSPEAGARETSLLEIRSATRQPPSCTTDPELALFCDASQLAGDPDDLDDESSGELVAADELGSPARFEDTSQPGDWQCPTRSCGGHRNLAVLGRCDLCDHPKPARARADSPIDVTMAAFARRRRSSRRSSGRRSRPSTRRGSRPRCGSVGCSCRSTSRGRAARVSAARWHRVVPPGEPATALAPGWPAGIVARALLDCAPAPLPAGYRGVVDCTRGPKPRYMAQATAPKVRLPRLPDTP